MTLPPVPFNIYRVDEGWDGKLTVRVATVVKKHGDDRWRIDCKNENRMAFGYRTFISLNEKSAHLSRLAAVKAFYDAARESAKEAQRLVGQAHKLWRAESSK